jgi:predicted metalloendopeptidase
MSEKENNIYLEHDARNNFLLTLFVAAATLVSCRKEGPASTTDPLPFPTEENKDRSVAAGDDFFLFCNGGWINSHPIPEGKRYIGRGVMGPSPVSTKSLLSSEPLLKHIMDDADAVFSKPEQSRAWIENLIADLPDPSRTSSEDYIRHIGKLAAKGVKGFLSLTLYSVDGVIHIVIGPLVDGSDIGYTEEEEKAAANLEKGQRFIQLLAEGMGIPREWLYFGKDDQVANFAAFLDAPPQALYDCILNVFDNFLFRYISEEEAQSRGVKKEGLIAETEAVMGYLLNYVYAQKYVSNELKDRYTALCEAFREQFSRRIDQLDWMSETTKVHAQEKLNAMRFHVAYPDHWIQEAIVTESELNQCNCFVEEMCLLNAKCWGASISLVGKTHRDEVFNTALLTGLTLYTVNSAYEPKANAMVILPTILMPPMVPDGVSEAYTYAAMVIIGHEMTHGFDSDGATYDKEGKKNTWWTVADQMAFEERQQLLVDCYNHLEVAPGLMPGVCCDGKVTLQENIADLGGFLIAQDAYKAHLYDQGYFGEAFTEQLRKFYEAYADMWCANYGEAHINRAIDPKHPNVHSLPRERVNGVSMNTDDWYELYDVNHNHLLYLPPERRTRIW